jgi:hypothetical protein
MLVAVLIGLILDTTWVQLGWLEFAAGWALSERAPLWILLLDEAAIAEKSPGTD